MTEFPERVALVSEHASPIASLGGAEAGGQNVYVDQLARQLAALGCEVDVYTRRDGTALPDVVEVAERYAVHHVSAGPPAEVARDDLFPLMHEFAQNLTAAWKDRPPDVAHAHFWMSGWASLQARAEIGVPVVQTFHALGVVKRRHQGTADTSPPQREPIERLLVKGVDRILATCSDEVEELEHLGARRSKVSVVPCGVGDEFTPRGSTDATPRQARHRIVSVSRLVPRKGIADVISALAELTRRHDAELLIAGGPDEAQVLHDPEAIRLAGIAEEYGVRDRCRFVGRLDRDGTAALMRSADLVACAPWYEPFGIVPVEAMACGVPIVGTAVGGLLDTVLHDRTGLLVPGHRPDLLANAMERLLDDPGLRRRLGRAGARRAAAYRWSRVGATVLSVYSAVLDGRAARPHVAVSGAPFGVPA